jgi:hypothetical protein
MTQKQIEQTRVIAEKDGWKIDRSLAYRGMGAIPTHSLNYLTDLNALHRVAIDVLEDLFQLNSTSINRSSIKLIGRIRSAVLYRQINGEYIDLFNAVYEAIVFLNENKENKL